MIKKIILVLTLVFSLTLTACFKDKNDQEPLPDSYQDGEALRPLALEHIGAMIDFIVGDYDDTIVITAVLFYAAEGYNIIDGKESNFIDLSFFVTFEHDGTTYKMMGLYYVTGSGTPSFTAYNVTDTSIAEMIEAIESDWAEWLEDSTYFFVYGNEAFTEAELAELLP